MCGVVVNTYLPESTRFFNNFFQKNPYQSRFLGIAVSAPAGAVAIGFVQDVHAEIDVVQA